MRMIVAGLALTLAVGAIGTPPILAREQIARFAQRPAERAEDPVCHLLVVRNPELSIRYRGRTYYFCTKADMEAFRKDPEKYLRPGSHTHPDPKG